MPQDAKYNLGAMDILRPMGTLRTRQLVLKGEFFLDKYTRMWTGEDKQEYTETIQLLDMVTPVVPCDNNWLVVSITATPFDADKRRCTPHPHST